MVKNILRLFTRKRVRAFHAWQVELTTRCSLQCTMCIRSGRKDWLSADMSIIDFRTLIPYFRDVDNVVLEGWGESLLHPDILECIRLVKSAGAQAGFVTSGQGLDEIYIRELLDLATDFIGFSFAGATAVTHNRIRDGSDLKELVERIKLLCRIKKESGLYAPQVHLVYLMLKDNIEELPAFVALARQLGVDNIVLLNQIAVINAWQDRQRVYEVTESIRYEAILKEASILAEKLGVHIRRPSLFSSQVAVCDENPLRNLYISVAGDISPCVFMNPPLRDLCPPTDKCLTSLSRVTFGNIFRQPLADIWNSEMYCHFRSKFEGRKHAFDEIQVCSCGTGMNSPSTADLLTEAPESCRKCYRIMGV
jgi:MoaA/NifB/PqqE/SkfB family radical SAM enzyme